MALYFYKALSKTGKQTSGYIDASSESVVRAQLGSQQLYPIVISLQKQKNTAFLGGLFQSSVSVKDKILFTKQLALLLNSGIPLLHCFELLTEQFSGKLKTIIVTLKDGVKEGDSLADGLRKYPQVFDNIYIQLVKAGEASGRLEFVLQKLVAYMERRQEISDTVWKAVSYPLFQLVIMFVIVGVMVVFALPQILDFVLSSGKEIPKPTQILMGISHVLTHHYMTILVGIAVLAIGFSYWVSTKSGKRLFDTFLLKIPGVSFFTRMNAVIQFSSTLGILLESGVTLSQALQIVDKIVSNAILYDVLAEAKDKIIKQGKLTSFLRETKLFPEVALYLIKSGEESGQLDTMLNTVARMYEKELMELTDNLTSKLGPIMIVIMGGIVGFIMMAVMGPIMAMNSGDL